MLNTKNGKSCTGSCCNWSARCGDNHSCSTARRRRRRETTMHTKEDPEQNRITKPRGVAELPRDPADASRGSSQPSGLTSPESLSTLELMRAITNDVERLVKTQIALAKA